MVELFVSDMRGIIMKIVLLLIIQLACNNNVVELSVVPVPHLNDMVVKLKAMSTCEGFEGIMTLKDVDLIMYNRTTIIVSAELVITEVVEKDYKVLFDIIRCDSKQQEDSCSNYLSYLYENACEALPKKNESYTETVERINGLDPHCPLQPGVYKMVEAPMSLDIMQEIPVEGYYKVYLTAMHKGTEKICCNVAEVEVKRKKN